MMDDIYQHMIEYHDLDPNEVGRVGDIDDAKRSHLEEHDCYIDGMPDANHKHDANGDVIDTRPLYAIVFYESGDGTEGSDDKQYALPLKEFNDEACECALDRLERQLGRKVRTDDPRHSFPTHTVYLNGTEVGGG